jgi:membrane-bound serine protease (ClpP class)
VSDASAFARSLAETRDRNAMLAAAAVRESRAFTDREAIEADPPLIDFSALDVDDLLAKLDGRSVKRFDGHTVTLRTQGVEMRRVEMTKRQHFLSAIAHPEVAYLLLILGMLGLTVELWNPGVVLPGVAGVLCLLLAFFALQILPIKTTGLLLVLLGIGLLVLELKLPSGVLGIGGTFAIIVGSVVLTDTVPGVSVGIGLITTGAITFALIFLVLGRLALASHRLPPVTGKEGLIGTRGEVRDAISPTTPGCVRIRGELWRAASSRPIEPGQAVRVLDVRGLTLDVEPLRMSSPAGEH